MLDGVMLLWFMLTGMSVLFVAIDIRTTPEAVVLKWGFVILTLFTGPFGAFFYVLGCREPLPGTHEQYVSATWKQVLGSTMHCAAGDGLGIVAGAAIGSFLEFGPAAEIALEYLLGFGFGWAFFQAYAMRDMAGGSYRKSLEMTFIPEFFSMNVLMAGMLLVARSWMPAVEGSSSPVAPAFWFIMSIALLAGFVCTYPMNWWLVTRHIKHGMMTVRANSHSMATMKTAMAHAGRDGSKAGQHDMAAMGHRAHTPEAGEPHPGAGKPGTGQLLGVGTLSVAIFSLALIVVFTWLPV